MNNQSRDPAKRQVKPIEAQSLLDFDLGEGESSDDSDFRIEDHPEESDDYSINSDDDANKGKSESEESDSEDEFMNTKTDDLNAYKILDKAKKHTYEISDLDPIICAGCLGSRSDDFNEIVECDGCGVTVHEGCYGVSEVSSNSSSISSTSTEPWFCEPCKAGVVDPSCELCPNKGGIFKETEVGAWVHLVCALYVPGVAFSEVERLSGVTLFEMAYSRWGARSCALCDDTTLARTGVCVGCDAGLCKTFFHVTCGQRAGLLAEAHSEEVEQADPFYAHCKLHSDKTLVKRRRQNWLAMMKRTELRKVELQNMIQKPRVKKKLVKLQQKYQLQKESRNPPWVPTQKMARMLYSSASAMRKFQKKAECMGIDTHALEFQDAQMAALRDVSRRWHVPPAFSVEFVGYYLDRNARVTTLRDSLTHLTAENVTLLADDNKLRAEYDEASKENTDALALMSSTRESLVKLYSYLSGVCPSLVAPDLLADRPLLPPAPLRSTPKLTPHYLHKRSISVPTAAALKMGVGFPLSDNPDARQGKVLSTSTEASCASRACASCGRSSSRQLMAACDTCRRHYHLHCLQPPLQRPPKKSKLYGWQCSECVKTSDSEPEVLEKKVPRRSRTRYSKDGSIIHDPPSPTFAPNPPDTNSYEKHDKTKKEKTMEIVKDTETLSPIKVKIKTFDFSSDGNETSEGKVKKEKKIKKSKDKPHKRSFTSPTLTNTPLMSITPIVADSDSHNENSNASMNVAGDAGETSFVPQNISFSALLEKDREKEHDKDRGKEKERDSKAIESSIENTLANLSSDIAEYKANRKRRKDKNRERYSPDLLRSPSKSHKHKRKKKTQDVENPEPPHPRITIKIKPIPKPDGSLDTQMFYVPTDSNDGPPPAVMRKLSKQAEQAAAKPPPKSEPEVISPSTSAGAERSSRVRGSRHEAGRRPGPAPAPLTHCDVCSGPVQGNNIVQCDECSKRYHFTCLEPPLNKNPKKRGYSWHCADCDPTDVEENR